MKKNQLEAFLYSTLGIAAMFLLVVAFNVITGAFYSRADLTADKAHTLSEGTRNILASLENPVQVRFYSTQVRDATPESVYLSNFAGQVEDLLKEFRQAARGKIVLEKYDPQPDSDAEDKARLDGIEGQPMPPYMENFYLGISVSRLDDRVAIPFVSPQRERLLEYDIARAISKVMSAKRPLVGVMSALPIFGMPANPMMMQMGRQQQGQDPWIFVSELKRDFTVEEVPLTVEKIDDNLDVLVVIHPRDITESAQYALDQFVLRGGKLLVYVDPLSIADNRSSQMNPLQRASASGSTMDKLFQAWGIEYDVSKCVADMNNQTGLVRNGQEQQVPAVLSLTREAMNAEDTVTSQLDNLLVPYAGALTGTPSEGLKKEVLVHSSENSQLIDKIMAEFGGGERDFDPSGIEYPLAIRLSGKFKTAFPDGKPGNSAATGDDANAEESAGEATSASAGDSLRKSDQENTVIIVADSDVLFDPVVAEVQRILGQRFIIPRNGNLNFSQSLVEQMGGDSNLIAVRSRATRNRPFTVVKEMEQQARQRWQTRIRELEDDLQQTQSRINELQQVKQEGQQRFILSPEQQQELASFREKEVEARKELKNLRRNLRRDVDSLENRLKWINIALMPLIVTISGILVAFYKRNKTAAK